MSPLSIVILISGNGSNLQAIIDAIQHKQIPCTIAGVFSDKPDAFGLIRAQKAHIPHACIEPKAFEQKKDFETALRTRIAALTPDLIVLAGFMRILSGTFVEHFSGKIINIHPSLLPKYKGLNTHQRVLDAKESYHGSTVHFVTETLDDGPIIAFSKLKVEAIQDEQSLKHQVQRLEHTLYPKVIDWFAQKRIVWAPNGPCFDKQPLPKQGIEIVG